MLEVFRISLESLNFFSIIPMLIAIAGAIIILVADLCIAKINKQFYAMLAILFLLMDLGYVVMGIVAEIVAGAKGYRNIKWNIASFSLFCLGPAGVFLAYFADPAAWAETMLDNGTSQEYIDMMTASAPAGMLPVILLGTIVLGIISGLVGKKLLKKQFEKAGITA